MWRVQVTVRCVSLFKLSQSIDLQTDGQRRGSLSVLLGLHASEWSGGEVVGRQRGRKRLVEMSLGQRCHSRRRLERQLQNGETLIYPPLHLLPPHTTLYVAPLRHTAPQSITTDRMLDCITISTLLSPFPYLYTNSFSLSRRYCRLGRNYSRI